MPGQPGCKETFPSELYREIHIAGDPKHKVICPLLCPGHPPIRHPTHREYSQHDQLPQIVVLSAPVQELGGGDNDCGGYQGPSWFHITPPPQEAPSLGPQRHLQTQTSQRDHRSSSQSSKGEGTSERQVKMRR